ncbi:hypothetical protein Ccrd_017081 [Cynara cardunculus var. scolymus]|uniref:Uncharacterized protein n=1 Tax=Cynara cardunculus var. scolymus TaxID=59895 RepID=A0A103Y8R4_CYNCS|nr:hypothetical protein Ccrd_017081 [Cynara cardunculus var. scolymus]
MFMSVRPAPYALQNPRDGKFAGNQAPLRSPMSGHITPYESTAPASNDKFTRYEHIIPAPIRDP